MFYQRLVLFALIHLLLYLKLRPCLRSWVRTGTYVLGSAFFLVVPFVPHSIPPGRAFEISYALSVTEAVLAGIACGFFVLTDVLKIGLHFWDRRTGGDREAYCTPGRTAAIVGVLTLSCFLYGFYEAWNVREAHLVLRTAKLPPDIERVRIVQASDLHIGGLYYAAHLARIMEMVRAAGPDIFVVTGDTVDGNMTWRDKESKLLADNGAKYGAFAVPGNHEFHAGFGQAIDFMERSGLTVLLDRAAEAHGIVIVGLDENGGDEFWPPDLNLSQDRFVLLLKHYPQPLKRTRGRFDLQLSGHTHGGQIWPLVYSMQKHYGVPQGLSEQNGALVYVSNGTGFWGPPFRFLTPPELTVIDLVRDDDAEKRGGCE